MDIDLLSKMVKELILDNDRVVLPGLGTFIAEVVPAVFSDRGYTINPPYRRLHFRPGNDRDDALAILYSQANGIDKSVAVRVIEDFVAEMKDVVSQRKVVVFPGLGRLRATKENNLFFVADADLDIYPDGFGLEPISLKTHQETPEEVAEAVVDLANILDDCPTTNVVPTGNVAPTTNFAPEQLNPVQEPAGEVPASLEVPEPAAEVPEPAAEVSESAEEDSEPLEVPESRAIPESLEVQEYADKIPESLQPKEFLSPEPEIIELSPEAISPEPQTIISDPFDITPEDPDPDPEVEPDPEPETESDQNPSALSENVELAVTVKEEKDKAKRVILIIVLTIVITVLVALGVFILLAHIAPDFIDSILYTPEELEILRW
ncbi:MAG: hypothetical protein ACI3ZN_10815 [Candidatus Cryptobacteroides sp.]